MPTTVLEVTDLGARASAWDDLVAQAPLPSPFLRSWWLQGAGTEHDHYVLVLDGETLIGGLALERHRILGTDHFRVLTGGKLCPDYLDLVTHPDRVGDVVAALRSWFGGPGSRVVDLEGVTQDAYLLSVFDRAEVSELDVALYEKLPASLDEYYTGRSRTFRARARKQQRRTVNAGVTYRRIGADEVPAVMEEFAALHALREDRQELCRVIPRIQRAAALGAACDEVAIYVAEREGRIGVVLLLFTTGNRLFLYQSARLLTPEFNHAGTTVDVVAIGEACADGVTEFDFLRGPEAYKFSFTSSSRTLLRVRAGHGPLGRPVHRLLLLATAGRRRLGVLRRRLDAVTTRPGRTPDTSSPAGEQ